MSDIKPPTKAEQKAIGLKILQHMESEGMVIDPLNIIYTEGTDSVDDWFRENSDIMDIFNDTRNLIQDDGTIIMSAIATTEPGRYYTNNPMRPQGAARIKFGQNINCWEIGIHGTSYRHEALMQCEPIEFYRDLNKDGMRTGDRIYKENAGINHHTTSNAPKSIGLWGAACMVGRYPSTHQEFMRLLKKTKRERFTSTVLDGSKLHKLGVLPPNPFRTEEE